MAASPLPYWGPIRGQNCYVTPAFLGVPNAKHGEKFRSGCLTAAFSGAQKSAGLLRNPCILGGPQRQAWGDNQKWPPHPCLLGVQKRARLLHNSCIVGGPQYQARGENQKWLPHPCLIGGPKEGGIAT